MRRHTLAFALLACAFAPILAGCFGRTGLTADDLEADDPGGSDTGGDGPVIVESGPEPDTSVVDTKPPPKDGRIDIFDVLPFPIPEGGPIGDCINCVKDNCGDAVNNCVNDPKCLAGLACTLTKCLTGGGGGPGGGFDFACITGCFKGDLKTAGEAISAFTCVIGKCGTKCGGFLGGGGIPGGGGG